MNKYLKLDQEVPYLVVDNLLVHRVLIQSNEKKREDMRVAYLLLTQNS